MTRIARLALAAGLALLPSLVHADQIEGVVVTTCGTPPHTYTAGDIQPFVLNTDGETCTSGAGGGGAGDASAANQDEQTALLTTMDADTGAVSTVLGTTASALIAAGAEGAAISQFRRLTTDIDASKTILSNIETLDFAHESGGNLDDINTATTALAASVQAADAVVSDRVTNTDGASTALTNFTATASIRNYPTTIVVYNSSATAGTIDFRDGTGGAVLWTMPIPAGSGSVLANGGWPIFKTTANTALAFDVSAALTTVTISISGFRGP